MAKQAPKLTGVLENELILGTVPKYGKRRKQKKQNEKEIMHQWLEDDTPNIQIQNNQIVKPYELIRHLSQTEKNDFDNKFHKPKNESQARYNQLLRNKNKKIVVANGPAGTGKTLFATEYGVKNFLTNTYEKLIFTRPSVSVDEDLGYLPGTLEEKMAPWVRPIYDILYKFISPKDVGLLIEEKIIEISPLGFMRGRTFKNCWIIADEMQNSTISQMKMLLTRLGENTRLAITGDLEQHDKLYEVNGLDDFLQRMKGKRSSSITRFEFDREDIQREPVVKEVLDIYSGETIPDYSSVSSSRSEDGTQEEITSEDNSLDEEERPEVNSLHS